MRFSRRDLIGAAGAALLFGRAGRARAGLASDHWGELRQILARHWNGGGVTKTAGTTDGELGLDLSLDLVPDDDMRFSGRLRMTSRWDTGTYSATYAISGYCWESGDAIGVAIENASLSSSDSLPSNLYWQGLTGKLRLYIRQGSAGHWLLDGTLYGTRDNNAFETQLSDI
ncbi:MAG: hypothetical protein ACKOQM_12205 [Novosphingobium sp.]